MVKYIYSKISNADVEEIMRRINSYITTNNDMELLQIDMDDLELNCTQNLQIANECYQIDARKPILTFGKFSRMKRFVKKILRKLMAWYVQDIVDQQNDTNAYMVRAMNEMKAYADGLKISLDKQKFSIEVLKYSQEEFVKTQENLTRTQEEWCRGFAESLEVLKHAQDGLRDTQVIFGESLGEFRDIQTKFCIKQDEFAQAQNEYKSSLNRLELSKKESNPFSDEWYVAFENIYRGSEETIRKRNEKYLKWFAGMTNVIDLGCGRGEFLDLLRENQIIGRGIDLNRLMLLEAEKKGLVVLQEDCIQFLKNQEDDTVDGIFAGQLVEHLNLNELVELLKIAYTKLMPNGVFVIETVNPMALGVFCYGFYIDATHSIPVHPSALQFIAQQAGFSIDWVEFTEEFPEEYKIQLTETMDEDIKAGFEKLNKQIYGAQDYYIVCRKRVE